MQQQQQGGRGRGGTTAIEEYEQNEDAMEVKFFFSISLPLIEAKWQYFQMAMTVCYHRIEELEIHGVNRNDITKLKNAGFNTIESVSCVLFFLFTCRN